MRKMSAAVLRNLRASGGPSMMEGVTLKAIEDTMPFMDDALGQIRAEALRVFGPRAYLSIYTKVGEAVGARKDFPDWLTSLLNLMATESGVRLRLIEEKIKRDAMALLRSELVQIGLREGWSIERFVRELLPGFRQIIDPRYAAYRVARIARTEVIGASNRAHYEGTRQAAKELDVIVVREWLNPQDERTRRHPKQKYDHWEMDGKKVGVDEPFKVPGPRGDEEIMFPADQRGSAGNSISCRCAVAEDVIIPD